MTEQFSLSVPLSTSTIATLFITKTAGTGVSFCPYAETDTIMEASTTRVKSDMIFFID
jgi:hypothetical protein